MRVCAFDYMRLEQWRRRLFLLVLRPGSSGHDANAPRGSESSPAVPSI